MPKITVVMPVYNAQKHLKQSLDSITNQTFKDIEIICINDGSTDSSSKILSKYYAQDNRFKVITQEHKNAGAARN
ncbi:MAG: glycosyltransferase family 2 protein, partial [Rickettsiales bacterium]|nr:glycosyltransferase family 2 protein [Rickettsiales bacterium]